MAILLVIGGMGFIKFHTTNELIKLKHKIIALDILSDGYKKHVNTEAIFIKCFVTNNTLDKEIFDTYIFSVYAADGINHFIKRFDHLIFRQHNILGEKNTLIQEYRNKKKITEKLGKNKNYAFKKENIIFISVSK